MRRYALVLVESLQELAVCFLIYIFTTYLGPLYTSKAPKPNPPTPSLEGNGDLKASRPLGRGMEARF